MIVRLKSKSIYQRIFNVVEVYGPHCWRMMRPDILEPYLSTPLVPLQQGAQSAFRRKNAGIESSATAGAAYALENLLQFYLGFFLAHMSWRGKTQIL